jgi:putative ABC transport system permease protein
VLTTLGIAAVVTIVVALSGLIDSFNHTLAAGRDEALAGARARITVDLQAPQPADGALVRGVTGASSVGAAEASLRLPVTLLSDGREIGGTVEVVSPGGRLWRPTFRSGGLPPRRPGIAIADRAADDLGVGIGDAVIVRHPAPTGPRSFELVSTRLAVTGINASPFRFAAYAGTAAAPALHVAGLVNRISVVPAPGSDASAVKRELLRLPGIAAVQSAAATTDAVDAQMAQFNDVLVVTVAIAVAMALLIAFNSSAINADERAREHATMFAYGVPPARVVRGNVAEALVMGAIGTSLGIGLGWVVLTWMSRSAITETMPDLGTLLAVAPLTYALAVIAGTVAVALAPLLTVRRLRRTDIPASLRVVE